MLVRHDMAQVVFHDLPPEDTYRQIIDALQALHTSAETVFTTVREDVQGKRGWAMQLYYMHVSSCRAVVMHCLPYGAVLNNTILNTRSSAIALCAAHMLSRGLLLLW